MIAIKQTPNNYAKVLFRAGVYMRRKGNQNAFTDLIMAAVLLHGRSNFMFTAKQVAYENIDRLDWRSINRKIERFMTSRGLVTVIKTSKNHTYLTLTDKGKEYADNVVNSFGLEKFFIINKNVVNDKPKRGRPTQKSTDHGKKMEILAALRKEQREAKERRSKPD